VEYWSWSRRQSSRFTRGIINGLLWKQFVTSRGTMVDISARMSSTSDAVTSALNWRASLTASLYNEHNVLGDTNSKVGDNIWHTEIWPELSVLWKTSSITTTILWRPSLAHQASAGRLMLCFCYFLSFFSSSFFNDRLEQRDFRNYQTDLQQIFRGGRHVGLDVQSSIGFATGQGTLPWQPILGVKSSKIGYKPSFLRLAFHNGWQYGKADWRVNSTEVLTTSYKN